MEEVIETILYIYIEIDLNVGYEQSCVDERDLSQMV